MAQSSKALDIEEQKAQSQEQTLEKLKNDIAELHNQRVENQGNLLSTKISNNSTSIQIPESDTVRFKMTVPFYHKS